MSHIGGRSTGRQRAARLKRAREVTIFSAVKFIELGVMDSITGHEWTAAFWKLTPAAQTHRAGKTGLNWRPVKFNFRGCRSQKKQPRFIRFAKASWWD